ncbi:MAG: MBL fold metallo-hydrolase [Gammaproteobacteria bacterium]|nr:MBL fold metallo-hydrolase [Gammaproteobacteria bacterium]MDH3379066.1 MBL fold metallo-hydrolase [Gammaproteobacteria bacterium]
MNLKFCSFGFVSTALSLLGAWALLLTAPVQASADQAQITVLYDAFGKTSKMQKDWGFSAFIEYGGKRILFDTGNNAEIFAHNVQAKGIDLTKLDFVVVSHRHGDHTSGLNHLVKVNPGVKIYVPKENFGVFGAALPGTFYKREDSLPAEMRYFDGKPPETLRFGSAWPEGNFTWVTESMEVAPGFHLILLKGPWGVDLDVMEISLAIDTPDGTVLVVGCSHPTLEKIVETAKTVTGKPIHLVFGGTHLLPAKPDEIKRIAVALRDEWKVGWIAPVHCTGEPAFAILKESFADRYLYAGLGTTLTLGAAIGSMAEAGQPQAQGMDDDDLLDYRTLLVQGHDSPYKLVALSDNDH